MGGRKPWAWNSPGFIRCRFSALRHAQRELDGLRSSGLARRRGPHGQRSNGKGHNLRDAMRTSRSLITGLNSLSWVIILCFGLHSPSSLLAFKDQDKKAEPFALLVGTCFNEQGFSLPGARVVIEFASEPPVKSKKKKWEMFSSPRGEFAARLPAGRHVFKITASKEGFKPAEKTASFEGDERQDIALSLQADSGKK